jgi:hypothetical protein
MSVLFSFFSGLSQCHLFAELSAVKIFFFAECLLFSFQKMVFANHAAGFLLVKCKLSVYQLLEAMREIWGGGDICVET